VELVGVCCRAGPGGTVHEFQSCKYKKIETVSKGAASLLLSRSDTLFFHFVGIFIQLFSVRDIDNKL
jgi:hypothetical protein